MKVGKLTNEDLKRVVLERLPICSSDVSKGPSVGLDCAVIKSKDGFMVVSSDPITGAASDVGRIAIHVSCNDIACTGTKPTALMLVIIAPSNATEEELICVIEQASQAAKETGVDIIGGHTEVSDTVNRFILMTTAIGFSKTDSPVSAAGAQIGDAILMTKHAALEGTSILAADFRDRLCQVLSAEELQSAMDLVRRISVVKEGVLCGSLGVHAMHDATEGGIMGAVWEISEASGTGCVLDLPAIPVLPVTHQICGFFGINPYALISSGSMIITTDNPGEAAEALGVEGILCTQIGKIVEKNRQYTDIHGQIHELLPPASDELYKIK